MKLVGMSSYNIKTVKSAMHSGWSHTVAIVITVKSNRGLTLPRTRYSA